MRTMRFSLILSIALLVLLAGCGGECKKDVDCSKTHFTAKCLDKKCVYTPIPGECGNGQCDGNENKCTCPQDCGTCAGNVVNSQYLKQQCTADGKQCVEDVPFEKIKPVYSSADTTNAGDKFKIETIYNSPFNMKKDTFTITLTLIAQNPVNSDYHIQNAEVTATTKDRRTITLTRQNIDKYIWTEGSEIKDNLIFDFPTAELEGQLSNLLLKVQYEYAITQSGKKTVKQGTLQNRYKENFIFVKPSASYPCPASCDDRNAGTRDICGPQTGYFCKHEPIPNTCGNSKCDGNENKCTCPQDCGVCKGSAGNFLDYTCEANKCVTILKAGTTVQPNTLLDDKSLGPVQLNNIFRFNNPFDISSDSFELDFKIYKKDPSVSDFIIETIRIMEGQQQIAELEAGKTLGDKSTVLEIKIPSLISPEEERTLTLGIWYKYTQDGQEKLGKYEKTLGKITLINPG